MNNIIYQSTHLFLLSLNVLNKKLNSFFCDFTYFAFPFHVVMNFVTFFLIRFLFLAPVTFDCRGVSVGGNIMRGTGFLVDRRDIELANGMKMGLDPSQFVGFRSARVLILTPTPGVTPASSSKIV